MFNFSGRQSFRVEFLVMTLPVLADIKRYVTLSVYIHLYSLGNSVYCIIMCLRSECMCMLYVTRSEIGQARHSIFFA